MWKWRLKRFHNCDYEDICNYMNQLIEAEISVENIKIDGMVVYYYNDIDI